MHFDDHERKSSAASVFLLPAKRVAAFARASRQPGSSLVLTGAAGSASTFFLAKNRLSGQKQKDTEG